MQKRCSFFIFSLIFFIFSFAFLQSHIPYPSNHHSCIYSSTVSVSVGLHILSSLLSLIGFGWFCDLFLLLFVLLSNTSNSMDFKFESMEKKIVLQTMHRNRSDAFFFLFAFIPFCFFFGNGSNISITFGCATVIIFYNSTIPCCVLFSHVGTCHIHMI